MLNALKALFRPAPVKGRAPNEPVLYRFEALQDFWAPEVNSQYLAGLRYSVRAGNAKLDGLAKEWFARGKAKRL